MALTGVKMTEEVWLACLSHALSTEKEEIMGLLLGDIQVGFPDNLYFRCTFSSRLSRRGGLGLGVRLGFSAFVCGDRSLLAFK